MKLHGILNLILTTLARIFLVFIVIINMREDIIRIYDVSGRLVRDLSINKSIKSQRNQITWDARDNSGRLVPNGIYFVRSQTIDNKIVEKIILIE